MQARMMPLLAGLDGGASRTRVRVTDEAGRVVGQGEAGPGSLTAGAETAARNARAALEQALSATGGRLLSCILVCGLAGHRQLGRRARFERFLAGSARLEVISDGYAALLGAHGGKPGAIVVVGTGSVGLRLEGDGRCRQIGGWGPVAGDEAGGSWLGREAVRLALRAGDGGEADEDADTAFLRAVRGHIGGGHEAILDWIAAADAATFAGLVPLLLEHEAMGDEAASRLIDRAVEETERLIRLAGGKHRVPVALMGGLSDTLRPRLEEAVRNRLVDPTGDAIDGALRRARGDAPPEVYAG
jgi:glucosamine kinase